MAHVDEHAVGTELDGIDRSIGTKIASSSQRQIMHYSRADMDGDGDEDIILVYSDGFIDLLQNMGGRFQRKQMIAYLPDLSERDILLGDFT